MKRFWNAIANGLYYLLWAGAVVSIVYVFGRALIGCGGALPKADEAKAAGCLEDIDYAIAEGFSCQAVVANVTELTRRRPECTAILGKAGITLVCHDGGSHD